MLHVHSKCVKISPVQLPGLRGLKSQLKAWRKRDDVGKEIASLRERVNKCFSEFTAFSAARTEHVAGQIAHSAVRIEQRLVVDGMENQVKAHRLEGMMAQVLLNTTFGRHKLGETIEVISSDPTFQSLESQYISAQLRFLIDSLEKLLAGGKFSIQLDPSDDDLSRPAFIDPAILTPSHALIQLLQLVVEVNHAPYVVVPLQTLRQAWSNLMLQLSHIRMFSEAIAWGQLNIACFRHANKTDYDTRALPHIARHLFHLSLAHRSRFETTLAVELSQQSLDLWIQSSELLPYDYRIDTLASMTVHAENLLSSDQKADALSNAEDAVSIARDIMTEVMECISNAPFLADTEVFKVAKSRDAFFVLARVLASLDRHLDSYATFIEGLQAAHRLPIPTDPPSGLNIDTFIDVMCKLAEGGHLSLPMLTECMMLFRDLARIYRNSFSHQFLRLLHASVFFSQQSAPTLSDLRHFLEPRPDSCAPELDITKPILTDLDALRDAVWLFFTEASEHCTVPLIKNIFITRFRTTVTVLQDLERSSVLYMHHLAWVLFVAREILSLLTRADFSTFLEVLGETIQRFSMTSIIVDMALKWPIFFNDLHYICRHALKIGAHDEGLQLCKHVTEYLACPFHTEDSQATWPQWFLLLRSFIFCDAGRFGDAIQAMQESDSPLFSFHWQVDRSYFLPYLLVRTRLLLRMRRHLEALSVIKRALSAFITKYWTQGPIFDTSLGFFFTELAAVSSHLGHPHKALENAEKAVMHVMFCGEVKREYADDLEFEVSYYEDIVSMRIHSLNTLSDCQATAGKSIEALESAQQAVSLYMRTEQQTEGKMVWILRNQESGGNAFFALSRRLAVSGDSEEALANGQNAIELYRELVKVAPRHLPTLAKGLRHLASLLQALGGQDEAIAACEEAVGIMRLVADAETHFLPALADALDQLAALPLVQGEAGSAARVTTEANEARSKFASLPPGPEWLFKKVVDTCDEEDLDWWELMEFRDALEDPANEGDEPDVEDDDEYHDALDIPNIFEVKEPEPTVIEELEGQPFSSPITTRDSGLTLIVTDSMSAGVIVPVNEHPLQVGSAEDFPKQDPSHTGTISKTQTAVNDALTRPLTFKISMQSRPVDVIWWILLIFTIAIVYTRIA
ncbi:hypothetical protein R3P38DRAFT_634710 [Favolaschia claudopus]|uniref:Uncharacterized protein n=1 Tax=Favolaschia claudopus TaxID=2862362 RepID=A0AAV9Z6I0_9AGAR